MPHTILLLALLGVLCVPCPAAEPEPPRLRAGAAAVDVTPKLFPLNMPGGFSANMAESAHDPLYARALVLDDGTTTLAIVVVDNLGVAQEMCEEAKALAAEKCGIAIEKILVSSTHTHSGPSSSAKDGPAPAVAYRQAAGGRDAQTPSCRPTLRCVPRPWGPPRIRCRRRSSIAAGISSPAR